MKSWVIATFVALLSFVSFSADLPRSTPEAEGISSRAVQAFVDGADKIEYFHSFMLLRHGKVIAEGWWAPYAPETPHVLWSLSKSFTSTAVGIAQAEGKLSVDDLVLKYFPEDAPAEVGPNLKLMRISDLLRMQTGQQVEAKRTPEEAWVKTFLKQPVPFKPGTHFLYNSMGTYTASAIVQKVTGMTVLDYLKPRLFEPLGIENPNWEASPQRISCGGWGLYLKTEDIARFGQLYLQKGKWNGKQLVQESWVEAATHLQTSNGSNPKSDWDQGYCYQFWRCQHNAYRGDGAFGQFCVVMPDQDAVLVITSGVKNLQKTMDLVWETLLPAFKAEALPADGAAAALAASTKKLALHPQEGAEAPAKFPSKKFVFPANERKIDSIQLEQTNDLTMTMVVRMDGTEKRIGCGKNEWMRNRAITWGLLKDQPVAASYGWTAPNVLKTKLSFYQTAFMVTATMTFTDNEVQFVSEVNVNFGPSKDAPLVGKEE